MCEKEEIPESLKLTTRRTRREYKDLCNDFNDDASYKIGAKVLLSMVSIIAGIVISQWGHSNTSESRIKLLPFLRSSDLEGHHTPSALGYSQSGLEWLLHPRPDVFVGAVAVWGLSIIGISKLCHNDNYTRYMIVVGILIGTGADIHLSVATGSWASFGSYVMVSISVAIALSMFGHAAFRIMHSDNSEAG